MLQDELVGMLCEFIRVRSVTGEEQALSDLIAGKLRDAGLSPEQDSDGNVVCFVGQGKKTLVVNGHLDTVPPAEGWETDMGELYIMLGPPSEIYGSRLNQIWVYEQIWGNEWENLVLYFFNHNLRSRHEFDEYVRNHRVWND